MAQKRTHEPAVNRQLQRDRRQREKTRANQLGFSSVGAMVTAITNSEDNFVIVGNGAVRAVEDGE